MKQEVSPPVVIGVIVLVVAIALGLIYMRGKGTTFKEQTTGSEQAMQQVQQGKPLYQPPPGAPIPGAPPAR
jgi:xanthine/uracil permease